LLPPSHLRLVLPKRRCISTGGCPCGFGCLCVLAASRVVESQPGAAPLTGPQSCCRLATQQLPSAQCMRAVDWARSAGNFRHPGTRATLPLAPGTARPRR
jgi:hypothetical protein